jgi:hypothetical protein
MPDVTVSIYDADAKVMRPNPPGWDLKLLKEIMVPREHWDVTVMKRKLAKHHPVGASIQYNPIHEIADMIEEAINEFDGVNLDIRIEVRSVPEEQRSMIEGKLR